MKNCYYYLLAIVFLISCQDDQDLKTRNNAIQVSDGRLKFSDENHFLETFLSLQQGNTDVVDGRIMGLNYNSYYSTLDDRSTSEDVLALDLYEYRVLLNQDREVQIGEKIYSVTNEDTRVYNLQKELLDIKRNEISYYDKVDKSFRSKDVASGKQFNVYYIHPLPYEFTGTGTGFVPTEIKYRWVRSGAIVLSYYYEAYYYRNYLLTTVNYFERNISDCYASSCQFPTSNPYGGITYNVSNIRYSCGASMRSHELTHGAFLRAVYYVKPSTMPLESIYHQDDLDIP